MRWWKSSNSPAEASLNQIDLIEINPVVIEQLRDVVTTIANTYHDNPFHNFDHACHVTMSVEKSSSRIVTPDQDASQKREKDLKSAKV
jgi:hypothetical protein